MPADLETVDLERVPVFAAGGPYHGIGSPPEGDHYTADDVTVIAADTQAAIEGDALRSRLKIGHSKKQKLLANSGLLDEDEQPAIGWQTNFRTEDGVVFSDWKKVPKLLGEQIKAGRWRGRSVELSKKVIDGVEKTVISATAILGAKAPAVSTLDDIVALHADDGLRLVRAFKFASGDVVWTPEQGYGFLRDQLNAALNPGPSSLTYWVQDVSKDESGGGYLGLVSDYSGSGDSVAWIVPFTIADDGTITAAASTDWTKAAKEWVAMADSPVKPPGIEGCSADGADGYRAVGHDVCRTHDGSDDGRKKAKIAAMKDAMKRQSYEDDVELLRAFIATTDAAWDGAESNWPDATAYCADSLIDENPSGEPKSKSKCWLPYRRDGKVYTKALAAIASVLGGGRGGLKGPSAASISKAKTRLASLQAAAGTGDSGKSMTDETRADSFYVPDKNDTQNSADSSLSDEQVAALAVAFGIDESDSGKRREQVLAKFAEHAPKPKTDDGGDTDAGDKSDGGRRVGVEVVSGDKSGDDASTKFTSITDLLTRELGETKDKLAAQERAFAERTEAEKRVRIDGKIKTAIEEARLHPSKQDEWRGYLDENEETMTKVLAELPVDETVKRAYGVDAGGSIITNGDADAEERLYAESMTRMFPEIQIVKKEQAA